MGVDSELILKAKKFLIERHGGQLRKNGELYVNHPFRVAETVASFSEGLENDDFVVAALLHDVLEDSDTKVSEISKEFGDSVALLVVQLTADEIVSVLMDKGEYVAKRFSNVGRVSGDALVIKLADRLDNVSDLNRLGSEFSSRYSRQTVRLLDSLEDGRELKDVHMKLIKLIREKMSEVLDEDFSR